MDHTILISKLQWYGLAGDVIKWLSDYLYNREQFVSINGIDSNRSKLVCGVPQGSILGPLLFLIYINDFAWVSLSLFSILFADDTNLFISHDNLSSLFKEANAGLSCVSHWFQNNKLSLNTKKKNLILFYFAIKVRLIRKRRQNYLSTAQKSIK